MSHVEWAVCLSVCLRVGYTDVPCKNGWSDQDAVWVSDSGGPKEPCIKWGQIPQGKWAISELSGPLKSIECLFCGVRSKKSVTASARLLQPTAFLPTGRCYINFSPLKHWPHWCGLTSNRFHILTVILMAHVQNTVGSVCRTTTLERNALCQRQCQGQ